MLRKTENITQWTDGLDKTEQIRFLMFDEKFRNKLKYHSYFNKYKKKKIGMHLGTITGT